MLRRLTWAAFLLSAFLAGVEHLRDSHEAGVASDALLCACSVLWPFAGIWPFRREA